MALDKGSVRLLVQMRRENLIGGGRTSSILEFGEQNWYGDVNPAEIHGLIDQFCPAEAREKLHAELETHLRDRKPQWLFHVAKTFYRALLEHSEYVAIDFHGTEHALKHDLNQPLPLTKQFQLVTNLGTGEHIFNQHQFFKSMHDHAAPGGLMMHVLPNQGAYDHGFYNYHPTLVFDLCHTNQYQMLALLYLTGEKIRQVFKREDYVQLAVKGELGRHSACLALLKKPDQEQPFKIPQQGYYDNRLSPELRAAWLNISRGESQ